MAKLPALPVVTELAETDLVYGVDVSDTTDDPTGSSVGITKTNLLKDYAGNATSLFAIETITNTTAGDFDFNNIPQGYKRLIIQGALRSNKAGVAAEGALMYYNADTTPTNYHRQYHLVDNAIYGDGESSTAAITAVPAGTTPSTTHGPTTIYIENYDDTTQTALARCNGGFAQATDNLYDITSIHHWDTTDAITRIRIQAETDPTTELTGTLTLYGERDVTLETSETITVKKEVPVVLTAGVYDIDLTNYQDGDRIVIEGKVRSAIAGEIDVLKLEFNADTTATNYDSLLHRGEGTNTTLAYRENSPRAGYAAGASKATNYHSSVKFVVEDYTNTASNKESVCTFSIPDDGTASYVGIYHNGWRTTTAAITSIKISSNAAEILSGDLKCYIEKQGVLPVTPLTNVPTITGAVKELVATITDPAGGDFTFDLTNFQAGDRIVLEGSIYSTAAVTSEPIRLFMNGDTTLVNYRSQRDGATSGAGFTPHVDEPRFGSVAGVSTTDARGTCSVVIEDYTSSILQNALYTQGTYISASTSAVEQGVITHEVAGAVTEVSIVASNAAILAGTLSCYIERQATMGTINAGTEVMTEKKLLGTITNATAGEFDFDSIPAGYDRLIIEGTVRGDKIAVSDAVHMFFNADTTSTNYHRQFKLVNNGVDSDTDSAEAKIGTAPAASAPAGSYASVLIRLEAYAVAGRSIVSRGFWASTTATDSIYDIETIHTWDTTDAVTRIQIQSITDPTDQLLGTLRLYGEREIAIGLGETGVSSLPVIQSANMDGGVAPPDEVLWSSESGWSMTRTGTGTYDVTFPSAATSLVAQSIVAIRNAATAQDRFCTVDTITTTSCTVHCYTTAGALVDNSFGIVRRLPDAVASVVVAEPTFPTVATSLPVVQSASIASAGAITSSNEAGWSVVKGATGYYTVTFPTAATGATEQWVVGSESVSYASGATYIIAIHELTATGCVVLIDSAGAGTPSDRDFTLLRRLPDAPAEVVVAQPTSGKVLIETQRILVGAAVAKINFSSIPGVYKRLVIQGKLRSTYASTATWLAMEFNADTTTANYVSEYEYHINGGTVTTFEGTNLIALCPGSTANADSYAQNIITLEGYADAFSLNTAIGSSGSMETTAAVRQAEFWLFHNTQTAAITQIDITPDVSGSLYGEISLYGEY